MARKTNPTPIDLGYDDWSRTAGPVAWEGDDDEADIRFSLTALGEAVVIERDRRRPKFRGFGPCGRVVA